MSSTSVPSFGSAKATSATSGDEEAKELGFPALGSGMSIVEWSGLGSKSFGGLQGLLVVFANLVRSGTLIGVVATRGLHQIRKDRQKRLP